eukprot:scaffold7621_cov152-Skeletonema_menzelii.AAC.6
MPSFFLANNTANLVTSNKLLQPNVQKEDTDKKTAHHAHYFYRPINRATTCHGLMRRLDLAT